MIELEYEYGMDKLKEMAQHQAALFDTIYDAVLAGADHIVLNEPDIVTLPMPWHRHEAVTEVVGRAGIGYLHKLKPETVEYIHCFPSLIETNIWEPVMEAMVLDGDMANEYDQMRDIIKFWSLGHAYDKAEDVAKELRMFYQALEIIPFTDEELYLLD